MKAPFLLLDRGINRSRASEKNIEPLFFEDSCENDFEWAKYKLFKRERSCFCHKYQWSHARILSKFYPLSFPLTTLLLTEWCDFFMCWCISNWLGIIDRVRYLCFFTDCIHEKKIKKQVAVVLQFCQSKNFPLEMKILITLKKRLILCSFAQNKGFPYKQADEFYLSISYVQSMSNWVLPVKIPNTSLSCDFGMETICLCQNESCSLVEQQNFNKKKINEG